MINHAMYLTALTICHVKKDLRSIILRKKKTFQEQESRKNEE